MAKFKIIILALCLSIQCLASDKTSYFDYWDMLGFLKENPTKKEAVKKAKMALQLKGVDNSLNSIQTVYNLFYKKNNQPSSKLKTLVNEIRDDIEPLINEEAINKYLLNAYNAIDDEYPNLPRIEQAEKFVEYLLEIFNTFEDTDFLKKTIGELVNFADAFTIFKLQKSIDKLKLLNAEDDSPKSRQNDRNYSELIRLMRERVTSMIEKIRKNNFSYLTSEYEKNIEHMLLEILATRYNDSGVIDLNAEMIKGYILSLSDISYINIKDLGVNSKIILSFLFYLQESIEHNFVEEFENSFNYDEDDPDIEELENEIAEKYQLPKSWAIISHYTNQMEKLVGDDKEEVVRSMLPRSQKQYTPPNIKAHTAKVIYNNEGYDDKVYKTRKNHLGEKLVSPEGPIGYIMHLPKKEIKQVIINIYGGYQKKEIAEKLITPDSIDPFFGELVKNGTAVIQLNLINLKKLVVHQAQMPSWLLKRIHQQVSFALEHFKKHPDLVNKKFFLYGSSFGGFMTVYHAMNYPNTFDGYIAHAAPLIRSMWHGPANISEDENIRKIKQPILLTHTIDDNRVHVEHLLRWYRIAKKNGLNNLIRLYISPHGNFNNSDLHGHFYPTGYYAKLYSEQLLDFMSSLTATPEISDWRHNKYDLASAEIIKKSGFDLSRNKADLRRKQLSEYVNMYKKTLTNGDSAQIKSINKIFSQDEKEAQKAWLIHFAIPYFYGNARRLLEDPTNKINGQQIKNINLIKQQLINTISDEKLDRLCQEYLQDILAKTNIGGSTFSLTDEQAQPLISTIKKDFKSALSSPIEISKPTQSSDLPENIKLDLYWMKQMLEAFRFDLAEHFYKSGFDFAKKYAEDTSMKNDLIFTLRKNKRKVGNVIKSKILSNKDKAEKLLKEFRQ